MIYFAQCSATLNIKIGYTGKKAESRLKTLQTGNPSPLVLLATMPGTETDEGALHRRFATACVAGEWFRPTPEILRLILDSARSAPTHEPASSPPYSIYLAGSMGANHAEGWTGEDPSVWRTTIVDSNDLLDYFHFHPLSMEDLPVRLNAIRFGEESHHYAGPYHFDAQSGHVCWENNTHGFNDRTGVIDDDAPDALPCHGRKRHIVGLCFRAIARADIVFAWIDRDDCYGTITELGYAAALGKRIWIASPKLFPDMWFPFHTAEYAWEGVPEAAGAFRDGMVRDYNHRYLADESKHLRTIYS